MTEPESVMNKLRAAHPKCDTVGLVLHAVHALKTPKEIISFVGEYTEAVAEVMVTDNGPRFYPNISVFQEAVLTARMNIGYSLGYLNARERRVWNYTLRHADILPGPVALFSGPGREVIKYHSIEELRMGITEALNTIVPSEGFED